jgi:hypothetical protein
MASKSSLEEMAKKLSKNLPKFIDLNTFEKRTLKIIRGKYDKNAEYVSGHGHSKKRKIAFMDEYGNCYGLQICKKQKGSEDVISAGVFQSQTEELAEITGIPYKHLEAYIKGSGKLYKKYIKKLEEEYGI